MPFSLCWVQAALPQRTANKYTVTYGSKDKTFGEDGYAAYSGWVCSTKGHQWIRDRIHAWLKDDFCRDVNAYVFVSKTELKPHQAVITRRWRHL